MRTTQYRRTLFKPLTPILKQSLEASNARVDTPNDQRWHSSFSGDLEHKRADLPEFTGSLQRRGQSSREQREKCERRQRRWRTRWVSQRERDGDGMFQRRRVVVARKDGGVRKEDAGRGGPYPQSETVIVRTRDSQRECPALVSRGKAAPGRPRLRLVTIAGTTVLVRNQQSSPWLWHVPLGNRRSP